MWKSITTLFVPSYSPSLQANNLKSLCMLHIIMAFKIFKNVVTHTPHTPHPTPLPYPQFNMPAIFQCWGPVGHYSKAQIDSCIQTRKLDQPRPSGAVRTIRDPLWKHSTPFLTTRCAWKGAGPPDDWQEWPGKIVWSGVLGVCDWLPELISTLWRIPGIQYIWSSDEVAGGGGSSFIPSTTALRLTS